MDSTEEVWIVVRLWFRETVRPSACASIIPIVLVVSVVVSSILVSSSSAASAPASSSAAASIPSVVVKSAAFTVSILACAFPF